MTDFYEVPFYQFGTKEELGHCIGKEFRASLAICDENLAKATEQKLISYTTERKTE
jgi:ribosomal protein L7Ae-like RNA K-turn-binding protein